MAEIGQRIRQARAAAGLSLRELAARAAPLTHTAVANYENGRDRPRAEVLLRLAQALNVRPEFFFRTVEVRLDCPRYRKSSRLPLRGQQAIKEQVRERLERYLEVEAVFPDGRLEPAAFSRDDFAAVESLEEIEPAASGLRRRWDLGTDPVENLADALEDRGVRVILLDDMEGFDGFSCWANESIPVVVGGSGKPWDRLRFDLAHELGELVLQPGPALDRERAAHRFAGAFLVPREAVWRELGRHREHLNLEELRLLREEYGLSIQAWIYRARDVDVIGEGAFRELCRRISAAGMRRDEGTPPCAAERPWRFVRLVRQAEAEGFVSPTRAAELLGEAPVPTPRRMAPEALRRAAEAAQPYYASAPEALEWAAFAGDTADE